MKTYCLFVGSGPLGVPSLGCHPGVWLLLMAQRRFAYPAGGPFLWRQKGTKERPGTLSLDPTRGFPLDLLKDGANAPYPLIPAGLFVVPCGGYTPSGYAYGAAARRRGMERNLVTISPRPAGLVAKRLVPHRSGEHRIRPTERRASARRHTLPGAPRLTVVRWLRSCLESEAAEGGR